MIEQRSCRLPEYAEWLEGTMAQTPTVFRPPKRHRVRLRTTDNLEKLHREVARRTRVLRILPDRQRCARLITAPAIEQSKERPTCSRCLTMSQVEPVSENLVEEKQDVLRPAA